MYHSGLVFVKNIKNVAYAHCHTLNVNNYFKFKLKLVYFISETSFFFFLLLLFFFQISIPPSYPFKNISKYSLSEAAGGSFIYFNTLYRDGCLQQSTGVKVLG